MFVACAQEINIPADMRHRLQVRLAEAGVIAPASVDVKVAGESRRPVHVTSPFLLAQLASVFLLDFVSLRPLCCVFLRGLVGSAQRARIRRRLPVRQLAVGSCCVVESHGGVRSGSAIAEKCAACCSPTPGAGMNCWQLEATWLAC